MFGVFEIEVITKLRLSGGRQKTSSEYLLADGAMAVFILIKQRKAISIIFCEAKQSWILAIIIIFKVAPVAFSLMASFMSAITLLGVTQENYTYGTQVSFYTPVVNLIFVILIWIHLQVYR